MFRALERDAVADFLKKQVDLTQLIKYFFVGASAALIDWLLYWILVNYGAMNYLLAGAISFTAATLENYALSVLWVFKGGRFNRYLEAGLVFAVSLVGLLFNEVFLYIFVDILAWHHMISKIAATGIVFFWNYFSRKKFIFSVPDTGEH